MKIIKPNIDVQHNRQIRADLLRLIAQPSAAEAPPCPSCTLHPKLACSSNCEHAPQQLSIDAVNYPIETNVVPLVYELASVRLIQPCWSCEGHLNPNGELWKIPQVSFYSQSPIYAQLLIRHISALNLQKRLTYPWHVALSDFGQTWDVTYTLEPNLNYDQPRQVQLNLLQHDLNTLADHLCVRLKTLAQVMLNELTENESRLPQ
ncbi:MAG: hypothetical protein HY272_12025 [Gammaproteobacteria bacterium]|nr:hypothetical protein [Gammaproteobacteria bacterium]